MRYALEGHLHPFFEQTELRRRSAVSSERGVMRLFIRSHPFRRCCSFLVLLVMVGAITLSMSMQHHATQAAGSHLAANSQPYTVQGSTQAEHSAGGTAYVGSNDNIVYALNARNGLIRWG